MKLNRSIRKFSFLISVLAVCLFILSPLILTANATTDQTYINSLVWDNTPVWQNITTMTVKLGTIIMIPINVTSDVRAEFNLTSYGNSTVYAYRYNFRLYRTYGGYPNQPDGLYLISDTFTMVGIYFSSGASGTYTIASYIDGSASGSTTLNYGTTYDIGQIVIFNNTYTSYSIFTSNLLVYSSGHFGESAYLIFNASKSYGDVGCVFQYSTNVTYAGSSSDYNTISNQYIYKTTTGAPPPPPPTGIDITQIPIQLGLKLGISSFAAGIIAIIVLLLFVELPLMIFASDNIILMAIFGILILCVGVALTWLPLWTLIIVVVLVALLFADVFRKFLTGQH